MAIALMMEAESTPETSVNLYETTRHYIPEDKFCLFIVLSVPLKFLCILLFRNEISGFTAYRILRKKTRKVSKLVLSCRGLHGPGPCTHVMFGFGPGSNGSDLQHIGLPRAVLFSQRKICPFILYS
jgi:hypothetical protein